MSDILKGNFKTKTVVSVSQGDDPERLEDRFEREALQKLGGSIAFVRKKKVKWADKVDD